MSDETRMGSMRCERFVDMTNCLVVDPCTDDRAMMCELLQGYEFELDTTGDAKVALERCRREMPDVVVFSQALRDMDAKVFLKHLSHAGHDQRPIVLIYSEDADPEYAGSALWSGANEYMVMPIDAQVLDDKLHQTGVV